MAEHVYAAGDAANLPLKHGGLGAQQADVAAAGIAAMAGVDVTPEPLRPSFAPCSTREREPLYITARIEDDTHRVRGDHRARLAGRREGRR